MIDALIAGRLHGPPRSRTSQNGKPFVTAVVRCSTRDDNAVFANVICFDATACHTLAALSAGDSLAIAGEASLKVYTPQTGEPRPSLDVLGHAVLTEYHVNRRRAAVREPEWPAEGSSGEPAFNDPLPEFA